MSETEGTPLNTEAPEMETTIDPRTGKVTSVASTGRLSVDQSEPVRGPSVSPELMEKHGDTLSRFQDEDGSIDMEKLLTSFTEKQRMISAGEHKKESNGEQPAEGQPDTPKEAGADDAPPPVVKGEADTGDPIKPPQQDEPTEVPPSDTPEPLSLDDLDAIVREKGELQPDELARYQGDVDVAVEALEARAAKRANSVDTRNEQVETIFQRELNLASQSIMDWAGQNLSEQDINNYNEAFHSGDQRRLELEALDLTRKFSEANGRQGKHYSGASAAGHQEPQDVFQSDAEYSKHLADNALRMKNDRAFSSATTAKMVRSISAGKLSTR